MSKIKPLMDNVAPDCIQRLERAAENRFEEAEGLIPKKRLLTALYLYGYCVEMCLSAAYYRSAGLRPDTLIDRDTRQRTMTIGRKRLAADGKPLMNSDPHPLVGWARFLEWKRRASSISLTAQHAQRLKEAIRKAEQVYKHWRPELRYKTVNPHKTQLDEVRQAASWFIEQRGRL
jgi:hypothetical protein